MYTDHAYLLRMYDFESKKDTKRTYASRLSNRLHNLDTGEGEHENFHVMFHITLDAYVLRLNYGMHSYRSIFFT